MALTDAGVANTEDLFRRSPGGAGRIAARYPTAGRVRTGIYVELRTEKYPEGIYFPVARQSDVEAPLIGLKSIRTWRKSQWIGGMGQRVFQDDTKCTLSACSTLRMNQFVPQPKAITPGDAPAESMGDPAGIRGVPKKFVEWGPAGATWRSVFLATDDGVDTRVYKLKDNYTWVLWHKFENWDYWDFCVVGSELHLLGNATSGLNGYWYVAQSEAGEATGDWKQTGQTTGEHTSPRAMSERWHECIGKDGKIWFSRLNVLSVEGTSTSYIIGSSDADDVITSLNAYNNDIYVLKPEGMWLWDTNAKVAVQKANLRGYFDKETGKYTAQWAQKLYFNYGTLLASWDGARLVYEPPVWDWADPQWQPRPWDMANGGEALLIAFDGRIAAFDGSDWHNIYRLGNWQKVFFSTAYGPSSELYHKPIVIGAKWPDQVWASGSADPYYIAQTRIFEFDPAITSPKDAEETAINPSFIVESLLQPAPEEEWYYRDVVVTAQGVGGVAGKEEVPYLRVFARPLWDETVGTGGFVALDQTTWPQVDGENTFGFPSALQHGPGLQLKVEFIVPHSTSIQMPRVTEIRANLIPRPTKLRRRWALTLLATPEVEFGDGMVSPLSSDEMMEAIWLATAQKKPITLGCWQENCWVYYSVFLTGLAHVLTAEDGQATGWGILVQAEEA